MKIKISGAVNDSIVDGTGLRFTLFTQGCPHHCKGCHNPQTHDFAGGFWSDTDEILKAIAENPLLDGITFSGGEPFLQPEPCTILAKEVHQLGLSVWAYTGYTWEALQEEADPARMAFLQQIDVLVDGPFIEEARSLELRFKGSTNQRTIDVNRSLTENKIILWEG